MNFLSLIKCRTFLILIVCILCVFLSGCASLSPLGQAAVDNNVEKIKLLVDQGENINEIHKIRPHVGTTALSNAVEMVNHNSVKALLSLGADPNIYSNLYADTPSGVYGLNGSPLMQAVLEEDMKIAEMLLTAGADINARAGKKFIEANRLNSLEGYDSLGICAKTGNSDIARVLLKYGANSNIKYKNGTKAVYEAFAKHNTDFVILLIENGLEIESDPNYIHYNADLAHIAADYYASTNEEKAIQFYKKAIELYPFGIKNYEIIADREKRKELGKTLLAGMATAFNNYAAQQQAIQSRNLYHSLGISSGRPILYGYQEVSYEPNMTLEKYYRLKAKKSEKNYTLYKTILNCYEKNNPDVTLADCIKNTDAN